MATDITGMLVRHHHEALIDGTGESAEIDFDIPQGFAINVLAVLFLTNIIDHDGALITVQQLLSLDGAALAGNALNTEALYDAHENLDAVLAKHHVSAAETTTGASKTSEALYIPFVKPILTARNPGWAAVALGFTGEVWMTLYYNWVTISTSEFGQLVASRRA